MSKKNKRKHPHNDDDCKSPSNSSSQHKKEKNPLLQKQTHFLQTLTDLERNEFFSPRISPDRRAELWMKQADFGEELINRYSWATPSETAIRILKEFSPLVEIGCGANAYWSRLLRQEKSGIDIVAYDVNVQSGGKIIDQNSEKKGKTGTADDSSSFLRKGEPSVLASKEIRNSNRTLFLCYPDEEDSPPNEGGGDDDDDDEPLSMGAQCLEHYQGTHVIHVGELFLDANLSMDQAPWGRSSAPEFQQRLTSEYHCLLKVELPNWLHVRDTISVWKRSETSTIVFAAEEEDDSDDEEVEYRHIPVSERLPINIAAPCLAHLLPVENTNGKQKNNESPIKLDEKNGVDCNDDTKKESQAAQKKKNKKKKKKTLEDVKRATSDKTDTKYVCPW